MAVGVGGGGGELANDGAPGKVRRCKGVKQASELLRGRPEGSDAASPATARLPYRRGFPLACTGESPQRVSPTKQRRGKRYVPHAVSRTPR
jgi:hypothetical protein